MRVNMVAGRDVSGGKADDLAELADRRAIGDGLRRHLVPTRNALCRRHPTGDKLTCVDAIDGNDDIIGGMETQNAGRIDDKSHGNFLR